MLMKTKKAISTILATVLLVGLIPTFTIKAADADYTSSIKVVSASRIHKVSCFFDWNNKHQ